MTSRASQQTDLQATDVETDAPEAPMAPPATGALSERHVAAPRSREEAEQRYIAARDMWTDAMHRAASGRSADLASLAIAQEAYELATAERQRWINAPQAAKVDPANSRRGIEAVVGQEFA